MTYGPNNNESNGSIKKLPCDHIFHKSCLRSWFQRQQTCPTCRTSILRLNNNNNNNNNQHQAANVAQNLAPTPVPNAAQNQAQTSASQANNSNINQIPINNITGRTAFVQNSNLFSNDFNLGINGPSNIPMHPFGKFIVF